MSDIRPSLQEVLHTAVDTTEEKVARYFKTGLQQYAGHDRFRGITVPNLRKIAKKFSNLGFDELQLLLESAFNEDRLLALIILTQQYQNARPDKQQEIFDFYQNNRQHVNNWNLVDTSAHLIIGAHLFKRDRSLLKKLAASHNLWDRRIAIVATWYFIRHSDLEWTFIIAQLLCADTHDLIQKAVGWMLREAGKKDEAQLLLFLEHHSEKMPSVMIRYAVERLSFYHQQRFKKRPRPHSTALSSSSSERQISDAT
jgi:3-methyladenine DNA glycosylase AlkD